MKRNGYIALSCAFGLASIVLPLFASADTAPTSGAQQYQFSSDGIYGCNKTGAAASSVGAFAASGSYVPVSDAAVELNTGYIVYLDCSLRPLVSALSEDATVALVTKITTAFTTGNNGNPQFSVNINKENQRIADNTMINNLTGGGLSTVNTAFQQTVTTAVVNAYSSATQKPNSELTCPYTGDLNALLGGQFSWDGLAALQNPACNPSGAYQLATNLMYGQVANAVTNNATELQWGQGVYPITSTDSFGNVNVVTPGAIVLNQAQQALQAGLLKTENANDIGQMVGSLFSGIGASAVTSSQGLASLTQPSIAQSNGSLISPLSEMNVQANANVHTNAVNTAITALSPELNQVSTYLNNLNTIENNLLGAITALQGTEAQCYSTIITNVCVAGTASFSNGIETCKKASLTGASGTASTTLTIATSTKYGFAKAVIQSQIAPAANSIVAQITSTQNALNSLNSIASAVSNSSSNDAQSVALEQLDQLIHGNGFPSIPQDGGAQQVSNSTAQLNTLVNTQVAPTWEGIDSNSQQTIAWNGSVPPNGTDAGWCNYNLQTTSGQQSLAEWQALWK